MLNKFGAICLNQLVRCFQSNRERSPVIASRRETCYIRRPSSSRVYSPVRQAASLYERAVNVEETAERHAMLAKALVLAQRRSESLWHYMRAADLYEEDDPNKVR